MGFTSESRERSRPVLPLAAMVDVLFLLLIFFMTASVFREQELQIDVALPAADTAAPGEQGGTQVVISLTEDGRVFLGARELTEQELALTLAQLAQQYPDEAVVIRGDQLSKYGQAVHLMDLAKDAGFTNVTLATVKAVDEGR